MNFDLLISRFSAGEVDKVVDEKSLIKSKLRGNSSSSHAYILFPPWGQKIEYFFPLRLHVLKTGSACLEYEFSKSIMTSDYKLVKKYINMAQKKIWEDINNLKSLGVKEMTVIGTSVGSVAAMMLANKEAMIKRLILNACCACPAEVIWSSVRLKTMKNSLEKKGMTVKKLKQYWHDFLPENNLDNLGGKEIYINISQADLVIPYKNTYSLISKMRGLGLKPCVNENKKLGHYLTAAKYYLWPHVL